MPRTISTLLALLMLLATALPAAAAEDPEPPTTDAVGEVVPGEVVVKWRDARRGTEVAQEHGLAVLAELGTSGDGLPSVVATRGRAVNTVIAELRADPAVAYAEPNYVVHLADEGSVAAVSVNDPKTAGQYSLDQMRVRDAWSLTKGGSGIVAVLDTGVQANHPDLSGRVLAGYDFVNNDSNAADDNGHGTWVAGIISSKPNDGYGIAGISWSDKILPVKIMSGSGTGDTSDLTSGIIWAANHGATVINMSVGGFPTSQYVQDAVNYAWNKGVVLVGAAGNNNRQESFFPASFANVVSVSATQSNDEFSNWSSYGPNVDVSAPGASVQTTNCTVCTYAGHNTWGEHTYISGTSFATPNVAGVIALIRARYPSYTPAQVVSRLISTVDDRGYSGFDIRYGAGRVNAFRAVGGSVASPVAAAGDAREPNNSLGAAQVIPLGSATRPTIYPAGDVDVFAVDAPRGGRLDVRVTGVVDTRAYPWNGSPLPIDPIVELYSTSGTLIRRVDAVWEADTELATVTVVGPTRILIRVQNYYANGSRTAYIVTPTFVDDVAPRVIGRSPAAGAVNVSRHLAATVRFDEPVTGVSSTSVRLRDTVTGGLMPATVTYDGPRNEARASVAGTLVAARVYRLELTSAITDTTGHAFVATSWTFTTGISDFSDSFGSPFEYDIAWLAESGITAGCGTGLFCPRSPVTREQMASFLTRGLSLSTTARDYFTDDESSAHEADINRLAASGITGGCGGTSFCPRVAVTREQMASFLARSLHLPTTTRDYFTDDERSAHEADINRLAASGITGGCGGTSFCPRIAVTREQMAAFLHRAIAD